MDYKSFERAVGKGITEAFDDVMNTAAEKDPEIKEIGAQLRTNLLTAVIPLSAIGLLGDVVFEKLNITEDDVKDILEKNKETYKKNLLSQLKEEGLLD